MPTTDPIAASPEPRRVRRPSWVDARLIVGITLVLGSVLIGARVLGGSDRTYAVIAVTHDVERGTVLGADDLHVVRVWLPADRRRVYLTQRAAAVGKQLGHALARDELVPQSVLGSPPALTRIAVALAPNAAPPLAPGERVSLWLTSASCPPVLIAGAVTVQQVRDASSGSFGSDAAQVIDIAVAAELADRVLTGMSRPGAQVHAGVLTGGAGDAPGDGSVSPPLAALECTGAASS